ncbi:30S ribosomal protein S8 [Candidatus Gottesmanbacteria bacterium]|nr:30S ribosomal protein S8 [Candidatus Gottesmanbacteria bacterium]
MMTDPIADFFIQIKNSYAAHKNTVVLPHSNIKEALARLLSKEGYIGNVGILKDKEKKLLQVELLYDNKIPKFTQVVRVSKPGKRVYAAKNRIPKVLSGIGTTVVSTSAGVMTGRQARKLGLGGELICKLW